MTDINMQNVIDVAKAAVALGERTAAVPATVLGTEVKVPVVVGNNGVPAPLDVSAVAMSMYKAAGHPPARAGRYSFTDLASLIAWAQRYATSDSAAFFEAPDLGESTDGSITLVVDDLPAPSAEAVGARRQIQASMGIGLSPALAKWVEAANTETGAADFCEFIEDHTEEIVSADVLSLTRNIGGRTESVWKRTVDDNGNVKIVAEDNSGPSTRVPRRFAIRVPTFAFDAASDVAEFQVNLRSRVVSGRPVFTFELVDLAEVVSKCVRTAMDSFRTQVPVCAVYLGSASQ